MLFKLSVVAAVFSTLVGLAASSPVGEGGHAPALVQRAAGLDDALADHHELSKRAPGPC